MYFAISQAVGVRFLNVIPSLDLSVHQLSNAVFEIVLLQKLAKIQRKENGKSKIMARLFFILWIRSHMFRDISGCGCSIFKCYTIIRFVFALAFQRSILNCSMVKTRAATTKTKHEVENRLFFIFWVRCNLLRDFSGSRRPIFKLYDIIRFVFPYLSNTVLEIVLRQKLALLRRKQNTKSKTMT